MQTVVAQAAFFNAEAAAALERVVEAADSDSEDELCNTQWLEEDESERQAFETLVHTAQSLAEQDVAIMMTEFRHVANFRFWVVYILHGARRPCTPMRGHHTSYMGPYVGRVRAGRPRRRAG